MRLGEATRMETSVISTGSIAIDLALGVGGLPRGRICEIYGPESSGKTTFALSAIAQAQKEGGNAVFVDVEHALDPRYGKVVGVDTEAIYFAKREPSTFTDADNNEIAAPDDIIFIPESLLKQMSNNASSSN